MAAALIHSVTAASSMWHVGEWFMIDKGLREIETSLNLCCVLLKVSIICQWSLQMSMGKSYPPLIPKYIESLMRLNSACVWLGCEIVFHNASTYSASRVCLTFHTSWERKYHIMKIGIKKNNNPLTLQSTEGQGLLASRPLVQKHRWTINKSV